MPTCITCGLQTEGIFSSTKIHNGISDTVYYCLPCYEKTESYAKAKLRRQSTLPAPMAPSPLPELFETDLQKITLAAEALPAHEKFPDPNSNLTVPIEISRIRSGSISFFMGAFINDGLITWIAFDADRHLCLSVQGRAGPKLEKLPKAENLGPNQCLRYTDAAGYKRAEIVTIVEATPAEVQEFALLANSLLAHPSVKSPADQMTDTVVYSFDLLTKGKKNPVFRGKKEEHLKTFISELLRRDTSRLAGGETPLRFCGLAFDTVGNMYTTFNNHTIWKVTPDGRASHLAGQPNRTGNRDGPGSYARFNYPSGLTIDEDANLYIADGGNQVIRLITPEGVVSTIAGIPDSRGMEDGPRATAKLDRPHALVWDRDHHLYVSNSNAIRQVSPDGTIHTLAGTPKLWDLKQESPECPVFNSPQGMALDSHNQLYVADWGNHRIRIIPRKGPVRTLTWQGQNEQDQPFEIKYPSCLAIDSRDNLFFYLFYAIYKITPDGSISLFAGALNDGVLFSRKGEGFIDGPGTEARFGEVNGMAMDRADNLYLADSGSLTLRKISPDGVVSTLFSFNKDTIQGSSRAYA